ncbi:hypothetical protein M413DRAFT_84875 [Hebeloma cylindrosporum]|uniref:Uncharacterized protein n=1 Tax=Hebeloma cylindrosporum TaxID=76867 RepID=A0A0C2Z6D1_HEBCY|nr:hypothetical protein M413DRAFT_84875 [Hebeloma cylindrosporum h7]
MKSMKMFPGYLASRRPRTSLQLSPSSHGHIGPPLDPPAPLDNNDLGIFVLPNEIFCAIFLLARDLSRTGSISESDTLHLKELPTEVRVSHVCRLWRSIAINFPNLWNTFRYGLPKSSTIDVKGRLDEYLKRSEPQLLDFWLNFRGDRVGKRFEDHCEMFRVILTHVDRWRRLTVLVDVDYYCIDDYCQELEHIHPVNLEHFAFCPQVTATRIGQETSLSPKIFINGAEKLTSVRLETNSFSICLPPLSNLTTLRIERSLSNEIHIETSTLLLLLALPSLENLSCSGFGHGYPEATIKKPIVMKNLRDLRCGTDRVAKLLSFIEAPRLHTLTLKDISFPHLQPNAFPVLTTLILCNCSVQWTAFAGKLSRIANQIQHLTVSEDSKGTFHLHALTEFAEGRWPRLRTLRCNIQTITRAELYIQLAVCRLETDIEFSISKPKQTIYQLVIHESWSPLELSIIISSYLWSGRKNWSSSA